MLSLQHPHSFTYKVIVRTTLLLVLCPCSLKLLVITCQIWIRLLVVRSEPCWVTKRILANVRVLSLLSIHNHWEETSFWKNFCEIFKIRLVLVSSFVACDLATERTSFWCHFYFLNLYFEFMIRLNFKPIFNWWLIESWVNPYMWKVHSWSESILEWLEGLLHENILGEILQLTKWKISKENRVHVDLNILLNSEIIQCSLIIVFQISRLVSFQWVLCFKGKTFPWI